MVVGVGIDLAEEKRFESLDAAFIRRIFTDKEIQEALTRSNRSEYYSSRFAAKEAVSKALGTGFRGLSPGDIEIIEGEKGKPEVTINLDRDFPKIHLSITHERGMSAAVAVAET